MNIEDGWDVLHNFGRVSIYDYITMGAIKAELVVAEAMAAWPKTWLSQGVTVLAGLMVIVFYGNLRGMAIQENCLKKIFVNTSLLPKLHPI